MIYTITGPSGSGKTSLVRYLLKHYKKDDIHRVVTTTTRKPRAREVDGEDYHFVDEKWFLEEVKKDNFREWTKFGGNYYGVHHLDMSFSGDHNVSIIIVDRKGAETIKKRYARTNKVKSVYIQVDSDTAFLRMSEHRGSAKKALERIKTDRKEGLYDSSGYDCILKNDTNKKDLAYNFMNYVESIHQWCKLDLRCRELAGF